MLIIPASRVLVAMSLILVIHAPMTAQPLGTDLIITSWSSNGGRILRLSPQGVASTVANLDPSYGWGLTMDTDNRNLVATVRTPAGGNVLVRIDPSSGRVIATVWSLPPSILAGLVQVDQNGDYVVIGHGISAGSSVYMVKRDGSAGTTVFTMPGGGVIDLAQDMATGDWILQSQDSSYQPHLLVADHRFRTVSTLAALQATVSHLVQDGHTGDLYMPFLIISPGSAGVLKFDFATKRITTLSRGSPSGPITIDRSPGTNGALIYTGVSGPLAPITAIERYSRTGANLGSIGSFPGQPNLLDLAFERSRNLGPELHMPPSNRIIRVSFPGEAMKRYVLALGLSGYTPGIRLADGRVIPLNPDGLMVWSAMQAVPPFLLNNTGVLDGNGEAVVTLDLNSLGNALGGVRLWAAALVLDLQAPLGVSQISGPMVFVL